MDALLQAGPNSDPMSLPLGEADRNMLAEALLRHNAEELTVELVHGALEALRHKRLRVDEQELKARMAEAERRQDLAEMLKLKQQKLELDRALAGSHAIKLP
jgi:hypothetical protein